MLTQETKDFIKSHREEDPRKLALQAKRYPTVDILQAVTQIEGWQAAREKLPAWAATEGIIYPPRISMEQCSSEATARFKSTIANGESLADLTGGFGIDFSYMAQGFKKATYIERSEVLCNIARENLKLLGIGHATVINGNSEEVLKGIEKQDWIFVDPARRDGVGRKVVALSDCEPDVTAMEQLLLEKSRKAMIKCSPMLDITAASRQLKSIEAIYIVAVNNECKELLFILGSEPGTTPPTHCVNIKHGKAGIYTCTPDEDKKEPAYSSSVGNYLYEPNAAIQKAGCHRALAAHFGIAKLHPNSHLFTSEEVVKGFPGRAFKVEKCYGFSKSDIKDIQALQKANIAVRNFPAGVEELRKRLKLADGGEHDIFATTVAKGEKVLVVCKKV